MSADQPSSSFGDSKAQPPTPKRTPTTTVLPSPVFETPKNNQGLDGQGGWTPRFAEEFSMFNATPGNLRGSQPPFPDFGPATPYCGSVIPERPSLGEVNAIRVNKFAPNSGLHLPPAESSQVLQSSPTFDRPSAADQLPASVGASVKKPRRGTLAQEPQGQTGTPPPSARKVERKLAPKLDTAMQNDEDFSQQAHFVAAAHQHAMGSFVTTSQGDMFGYPLSAPATAPAFGNQRSFWDSEPSLAGMDIDFGPNGGNVFQPPPTPHQVADAVGWAGTNQMLRSQANGGGHGGGHVPTGDHQSALVSQPAMSMATSSAEHSMFAVSYPTPMEDPFGVNDDGGAVNPGLLFSRPQSASMDMTSFDQLMPAPSPSVGAASQGGQTDSRGPSIPKAAGRNELRRSASAKDVTRSKQDRASASSPVKSVGRPGLSRSLSENRGRKAIGRPSLPTLAPRPQPQLVNNAGVSANRPVVSQAPRPSGRSSPPKSSHRHHHRLSGLSSIPEASKPQMRTQATLKIDANGRARVEAVVVVDERSPSAQTRPSSCSVARRRQLDSSEDGYPSSTDEEPIIIPSRNTSFALPDPRKPTAVHPFHSSQRSISARSSTSYSTVQGRYQDGGGSDGETIVDEPTPASKVSGDAASELQKLRETRQRQRSVPQQKWFSGSYSGYPPASSPTTPSETSLLTRAADSRRCDVRCFCNRAEVDPNDFLVQCESCEMFVHGRCVSISQRTMPSIYICGFCANTPNPRRLRDKGRLSGAIGPPGGLASSSPPHKSLKSFR